MAAKGLPNKDELKLISRLKNHLPADIAQYEYKLPQHGDYVETRQNLRRAVKLLRAAGYDVVNGKMTNLKTGESLEIEVLGNSANGSSFTRVLLPFMENLKKIGIKMTFRNLETNIFKNRLDTFDFEMAILGLRLSNLPGNELKELFGSTAADVHGSYNLAGIKNKAVDELIEIIISAKNKDEYIAATKMLDRVLLHEHYIIPQWYSPHNRIAYKKGLKHPLTAIPAGFNPFTWWMEK